MQEEKKSKLQSRILAICGVLAVSLILVYAFLIGNVSNIGKRIKCPTYPIDEEYEGTIKAEYKSLVLIDGTYNHIDFDKMYDGCYRDAGLEDNSLVCPNGYNSGARIEEKGERVLDMKEDHCYSANSDESMLEAIYEERHNKK